MSTFILGGLIHGWNGCKVIQVFENIFQRNQCTAYGKKNFKHYLSGYEEHGIECNVRIKKKKILLHLLSITKIQLN